MLAAAVSIALMIVVLFKYGLRDDPPPKSSQPHAGAQHHTAAVDPIAGTHMGGQPAPIQVFAKAQVGDWAAYRIINRSTLFAEDIPTILIKRVTAADDRTVTIEHKGRMEKGDKREEWTREYPRQGLTLDQLVGNDVSEWRLFDVKTSDDTHEVGGRAFKCKQITYAAIDPLFPNKKVRVTYWYSDELPGGLVEERDIQDLDTTHMEQLTQLIGFGTATATTWGTKPDGV
jgi:hypothetical protein